MVFACFVCGLSADNFVFYTLCRLLHQRAIPVDVFRLCLILCCRMFSLWLPVVGLILFFCGCSLARVPGSQSLAAGSGERSSQSPGYRLWWLGSLRSGSLGCVLVFGRRSHHCHALDPVGPRTHAPHGGYPKVKVSSHHHHKKAVFAAWNTAYIPADTIYTYC